VRVALSTASSRSGLILARSQRLDIQEVTSFHRPCIDGKRNTRHLRELGNHGLVDFLRFFHHGVSGASASQFPTLGANRNPPFTPSEINQTIQNPKESWVLDDVLSSVGNPDESGNFNLKALLKPKRCPVVDRKLYLVRFVVLMRMALMRRRTRRNANLMNDSVAIAIAFHAPDRLFRTVCFFVQLPSRWWRRERLWHLKSRISSTYKVETRSSIRFFIPTASEKHRDDP
jgi:hypothetical protein